MVIKERDEKANIANEDKVNQGDVELPEIPFDVTQIAAAVSPEIHQQILANINGKMKAAAIIKNDPATIKQPIKMIPRSRKVSITVSKDRVKEDKEPDIRCETFYQVCWGVKRGKPQFLTYHYINRFGQVYNKKTDYLYPVSGGIKKDNKRDLLCSWVTLTDKQLPLGANNINQLKFETQILVANTWWVKKYDHYDCDHVREDLIDDVTGMLNCEPFNVQHIEKPLHDKKTHIKSLIELPGFTASLLVRTYESLWGLELCTVDHKSRHYEQFSSHLRNHGNDGNALYSYCDKYFSQEAMEQLHDDLRCVEWVEPKLLPDSELGESINLSHHEEVDEEFSIFYPMRYPDFELTDGCYINRASQIYSSSSKIIRTQSIGKKYKNTFMSFTKKGSYLFTI